MIIIAILLLIFVVPYGVDAAYEDEGFRLGIKAGPFRIWLLPKKGKTEKTVAAPQVVEPAPVETNVSDEEELAAVITAAIMMCMEAQGEAPVARTNTGFVVRKIKKI